MKNILKALLSLLITIAVIDIGFAQYKEDAYRLSYLGLGIGARSLGMGTAYTSISNDFSAAYWNPAGLGQVKTNEFSVGLSSLSYNNSTGPLSLVDNNSVTFLRNQRSFTNTSTNLNSIGLVFPFPVRQGSLVFAIGYNRQSDFTTALAFQGFNQKDSTKAYPDNVDIQTKVLEGGGLNNWTAAGAIEAAMGLYLGASLSIISGSYTYNRDFLGSDVNNQRAWYQINRKYLINEDVTGFTGRLGLLYETRNHRGQFGINIKLPSHLSVRDDWSDIENYYDDIPDSDYVNTKNGYSEFDVVTPFVFSAGLSWSFGDLLLAVDIEYTDWTQMEFRNTYADLIQENTVIKDEMKPTVNFRLGAECAIPETDLRLRAGFAYIPSPFTFQTTSNAQKYITCGLGWLIEDAIQLDFGYAYGFWETSHQVTYDPPYNTITKEKIKTHSIIATAAYRF
jgi:long-subunit fatty acid transport protein